MAPLGLLQPSSALGLQGEAQGPKSTILPLLLAQNTKQHGSRMRSRGSVRIAAGKDDFRQIRGVSSSYGHMATF